MFSRLAMRLRRRRNNRRCSGRSVSIKVIVSSGDGPDGAAGVAVSGGTCGRTAAVEPLQASSVCGVMARQGRCVAEAGVRDAASRAASKHAEAWVCPPASFPWPPLGSDSLSSVPPPLPGFRSSARRLREARRAAGRMWVGGPVGRNAPTGSLATDRATRTHRRGCCRCRPARTGTGLYGACLI